MHIAHCERVECCVEKQSQMTKCIIYRLLSAHLNVETTRNEFSFMQHMFSPSTPPPNALKKPNALFSNSAMYGINKNFQEKIHICCIINSAT